jgi:hypothetical protein
MSLIAAIKHPVSAGDRSPEATAGITTTEGTWPVWCPSFS